MKCLITGFAALCGVFLAANFAPAAIVITEAMSSSSAGGTNDWFEVTNTGSSAVDLTNYRMDDSSPTFATSVLLSGVSLIAPGESVVFLEQGNITTTPVATAIANFRSYWGANATNIQIGYYLGQGAGVGLSSSGDAVNLYDASASPGNIISTIAVPTATTGVSFEYLTTPGTATLSVVGTLGAYTAAGGLDVGSPGFTTSAVPEPTTWALLGCGLIGLGVFARRRQQN